MTVVVILLCLIVCTMGYIIWNLLNKVEKSEDLIEFQNKFIESLYTQSVEAYDKLKEIDTLGAFEADDEVGYFFKQLKNIQKSITDFTTQWNDQIAKVQ